MTIVISIYVTGEIYNLPESKKKYKIDFADKYFSQIPDCLGKVVFLSI